MKWTAFGAALITIIAAQAPVAHATLLTFGTSLGPEAPGATGSGSSTVVIDDVADTLRVHIDWTGLSGTTTVSHIHCCTAVPFAGTIAVAVTPGTFPGFPVGLSSGSYDSAIIDLDDPASYTASFLTTFGGGTVDGAEAALIAGIETGHAYVNVHSTTFPGGEIRGFLVPEPSSLLLLAAALGSLGLLCRKPAFRP